MPTPDLRWLAAVRAERLARQSEQSFGADPVAAVLGSRPVGWLSRAGWRVAGHLHDALGEGPAPVFRRLDDVLLDPGLDAVVLQTGAPGVPADAVGVLPDLAAAGLHLVVDGVDGLDPAACRDAVATAEDSGTEHVVTLGLRFAPGVTAAVADATARPVPWVRQVVAPAWHGGADELAELLDVALRFAGPVVAVRAATIGCDDLPAQTLSDGTPVVLAVLCETGATVLVGRVAIPTPSGAGPANSDLFRLAGPDGTGLLVRRDSATRVDGTPLPAAATPQVPGPARRVGPEREWLTPVASPDVGVDPDDARTACAARLALRLTQGDDGWLAIEGPGRPLPASLRDAVVLLTVIDALRRSRADDAWVELA